MKTTQNYFKSLAILAILFSATTTFAQEEEAKKVSISGSVDAYYQTNLSASDTEAQSFGTSFADELGFALGMANIIATYEGEKTGAVADVTFGPRGDSATGGYNLNQLYAYWNVSDATTLTMGRFNTFLGYEVISPVGNFNYSTSYLFSSGPFSHVGLKADFALSDDFSLMLALMNVTDTNNNLTGVYSAGAQLGYAGQYLNLYYDGGEVLGFEIDYTGGFDLSDDFFLGINAAYADNEGEGFSGVALYPQLATSDDFTIGLRGEYFATRSDFVSDDPSVFAATITGSYTVENLTIKPEIRLDSWGSDFEPYFDADGAASKSLSSFLIAAVYSF
ncbi:outer membrane beta-barrel protein [Maribacter polysaccharolyticus]|uniref:outer membrane beta-barrel protein n=1 Tax=Maribacter polysaccharolyticus TaxID=3020831 RepID=UPI00237F1E39|nr:outer membrane beta-barrel protein [Maribacter polysaccharolyticus]MDE3741828.1 outer membrane beta-barrel protein [Maribacter polysaccharolyticus]